MLAMLAQADAAAAAAATPRVGTPAGTPRGKLSRAVGLLGRAAQAAARMKGGAEPTAEAAAAAALHKSLGVRNPRLQESLAANADVRPRTLDWLLRQLGEIYRARAADDDRRRAARQPPAPPAEFLFAHLATQYGTRALVDRSAAELSVTVAALAPSDARVALFRRFVSEEWGGDAMALFLDGMSALEAPSAVPCVELPLEAQPRGAPREPAGWVDARKALAVGDRLLGPRPPANSQAWLRALESKARGARPHLQRAGEGARARPVPRTHPLHHSPNPFRRRPPHTGGAAGGGGGAQALLRARRAAAAGAPGAGAGAGGAGRQGAAHRGAGGAVRGGRALRGGAQGAFARLTLQPPLRAGRCALF